MTRDDIIRMAREAGCLGPGAGGDPNGLWEPHGHENVTEIMFNFATLVAAAERRKHQADIEKWKGAAVTAEKWRSMALSKDGDGRTVRAIQVEARDWEREACAKVCEEMYRRDGFAEVECEASDECAAAIRARGNE